MTAYTSSTSTVPFTPACLGTPLSASNSAVTVAELYVGANQLQIANKTSAWAHVAVAATKAAATASIGTPGTQNSADYPVAPGAVVVISVDSGAVWAAVILDAAPTGSAIVVLTPGQGN